jgi:hypothetical protein
LSCSPARDYRYIATNRAPRALHPDIVTHVVGQVADAGATIDRDEATDLLHIDHEFTASGGSRCSDRNA